VALKLKRSNWCEEAKASLMAAMGDDSQYIENEVLNGVAILWDCIGCGWLVTRLEDKELVFVAGSGKKAKEVIKLFLMNNKKIGFTSCRIHSARGAMGRYLEPLGFKEVERVYRLAL